MSIITDQVPSETQPGAIDPDPESSLTTGQAAALLQVVPQTVARWATEGRLPHTRTLGGSKGCGHRRFRESDVRALIQPAERAARLQAAFELELARWGLPPLSDPAGDGAQ